MGTKGKKNIPITARVESGLFNQKKGVREPLLFPCTPAGPTCNKGSLTPFF